MNSYTFKKVHPALTFLLTNLTLGAYVPYWFISRRNAIGQLGSRVNLKYKILKTFFVFYVILAFYYIVGKALFTDTGANFVETINLWITFTGLGITYYCVFRLAEALEEEFEKLQFNRALLLLFHIWYLQFKINKLPKVGETNENKKNDKKRKRLAFN